MFNLSARDKVSLGITMGGYCAEAKVLGCKVSAIRAVDEIESAGSGFLANNRPKILFEGHHFYKALKEIGMAEKARSIDHSICYPKWTREFYIGGAGEYARLAKATQICFALGISDSYALLAASWGRFQIMGDNFAMAGYDTVENFVEDMFTDEYFHLKAFGEFVKADHLVGLLQQMPSNPLECAIRFASGYNGTGYAKNDYHHKIANAFRKFDAMAVDCNQHPFEHVVDAMVGIRVPETETGLDNTAFDDRHAPRVLAKGMKGEDVGDVQDRLIAYGYLAPNGHDNDFGTKTKIAVIAFQENNGLTADGIVGDTTRQRLFA